MAASLSRLLYTSNQWLLHDANGPMGSLAIRWARSTSSIVAGWWPFCHFPCASQQIESIIAAEGWLVTVIDWHKGKGLAAENRRVGMHWGKVSPSDWGLMEVLWPQDVDHHCNLEGSGKSCMSHWEIGRHHGQSMTWLWEMKWTWTSACHAPPCGWYPILHLWVPSELS